MLNKVKYTEDIHPKTPESNLVKRFPNLIFWKTIDLRNECGAYWHLHAKEVSYNCSELVELFRLIADDEVRNVMLISLASQFVFHPYDGGADVILSSQSIRDNLKNKFGDWLSNHPEGF